MVYAGSIAEVMSVDEGFLSGLANKAINKAGQRMRDNIQRKMHSSSDESKLPPHLQSMNYRFKSQDLSKR